jgi:beta-phosphoglucomutase
MTFTPKAILFDLDGTLIDSERAFGELFQAVCLEYGIAFSVDNYFQYLAGKRWEREIDVLHLEFPSAPFLEIIARAEKEAGSPGFSFRFQLSPGTLELLNEISESGIPIGIVTNSTRETVDLILSRFRIGKYFSFLTTYHDTIHKKPHPEPYLFACEKLGLDPSEVLVFEDSDNGILSALSAGTNVIAIRHPTHSISDEFRARILKRIEFLSEMIGSEIIKPRC